MRDESMAETVNESLKIRQNHPMILQLPVELHMASSGEDS